MSQGDKYVLFVGGVALVGWYWYTHRAKPVSQTNQNGISAVGGSYTDTNSGGAQYAGPDVNGATGESNYVGLPSDMSSYG